MFTTSLVQQAGDMTLEVAMAAVMTTLMTIVITTTTLI
jgi:hypothetical protein